MDVFVRFFFFCQTRFLLSAGGARRPTGSGRLLAVAAAGRQTAGRPNGRDADGRGPGRRTRRFGRQAETALLPQRDR